ncbi:MAG: hypothetical protein ACKOSQ_06115 [Planctomycetaceae bacterium]
MTRRVAVVAIAAVACWTAGCGARTPVTSAPAAPPAPRESADKLLHGAFAVLDRLDDFDEARGMELVFERVTQWSRAARPEAAGWRPDPLVASVPADLRAATGTPPLDTEAFAAPADVIWLRDERWLADIARFARGNAVTDVEIAANLFRWTVRSLAVVADPPLAAAPDAPATRWWLPGEILLAGRASPAQRAWIFLALVRHAGLDGAMLATVGPGGVPRPWIPAVVCDGEAYLFDAAYGMPVPGPRGAGIATARQAAGDPAILAALSLPERAYPVQAGDVAGMSVLVAGDPWSLSRRMAGIAPAARTLRDMRLAVDASAVGAAVAAALPGGDRVEVRLWEFPWTTLARRRADPQAVAASLRRDLAPLMAGVPGANPAERGLARPLFAARVREFRGDLEGAKTAYLAARPGRDVVAAALAALPPAEADAARALLVQMKEDAAFWLGVLTLGEGEWTAAVDYLARMTLAAAPDSRWTDAARQNLGTAYAALGRDAEAAAVLRQDESPQRFGSRLTAARLDARRAEAPP